MPSAIIFCGGFLGTPEKVHPHHLHAAFFRLMRQVDLEMAHRLHALASRKGFTLSPLFLRRKTLSWFRITLLENEPFLEIMNYFLKREEKVPVLDLGEGAFTIEKVQVLKHPWGGVAEYKELEQTTDSPTFSLEFFTPTVFRKGDLDLPLPLPRLIFRGLLEKWNYFSGRDFPSDFLEAVERAIGIQSCHIYTRPFFDGRVTIPGFVGRVRFFIHPGATSELRHQIQTLGRFAFYAGVGRKTTHGMGMVRVLKE